MAVGNGTSVGGITIGAEVCVLAGPVPQPTITANRTPKPNKRVNPDAFILPPLLIELGMDLSVGVWCNPFRLNIV
jgi:hypothetical protein